MFKRKIEETIKNELNNYKKPILITGVRQCGKTTLMKELSKAKNHIYINFEQHQDLTLLIDEINLIPEEIINTFSLILNTNISEDTLIVLDEIQIVPKLITSFKYFSEQSNFKIIASGSNLGSTIFKENFSFPVGNVSLYTMYPMDFDEFLWATGKELLQKQLLEGLKAGTINSVIHKMLEKEFTNYLIVGGMPEVIDAYINSQDFNRIQEILLATYENDFTKYADNKLSLELINLWRNIGNMLAKDNQKFQAKLLKKGSTINSWNEKVLWLKHNGLINQINAIKSVDIPISSNIELNHYKLFYFDVGVLTKMFNYQKIVSYKENNKIFLGIICENYISNVLTKLYDEVYYYTHRTSEIDFIIEANNSIIPIEIKSAYNTKAKSLDLYIKQYNPDIAIISSLKELNLEGQKKYIPLYAMHLLKDIIN